MDIINSTQVFIIFVQIDILNFFSNEDPIPFICFRKFPKRFSGGGAGATGALSSPSPRVEEKKNREETKGKKTGKESGVGAGMRIRIR